MRFDLCISISTKSLPRIVGAFRRDGWKVSNASWTEYEIETDYAELMLLPAEVTLIDGGVKDAGESVDHVLHVLSSAGFDYEYEVFENRDNLVRAGCSWSPGRHGREEEDLERVNSWPRGFGQWGWLVAMALAAWWVMTWTHELGHVLGGWCSGATLQELDLRPWRLPYSLYEPDPMPLVTLWSGPLLGVLIPVSAALVIRQRWMWAIAYFCVLANGLYLAAGWIAGDAYLDSTQLLEKGANPITLAVFCIVTTGWGYWKLRMVVKELLNRERT